MGTSLIMYGTPTDVAWAVTGGTILPQFLTDSADLNDGCPANQTEIQWNGDAQTTSSVVKVQAAWPDAQPVRVIAVRNTSLPVGAKVTVTGMRATDMDYTYALGGNSATQNVFQFADGSTGLIIVCPASNDPLVGVQVTLWNNLASATFLAAGDSVFIGDIDFYQAYEPPEAVEYDWKPGFGSQSVDQRTGKNQPGKLQTRAFGSMQVGLTVAPFNVAFGQAGQAMDYDQLAFQLVSCDKAGVIVRYTDTTGALDTWALHRTATIGVSANVERPQGQGGNFFTMSFAINEAPPGN